MTGEKIVAVHESYQGGDMIRVSYGLVGVKSRFLGFGVKLQEGVRYASIESLANALGRIEKRGEIVFRIPEEFDRTWFYPLNSREDRPIDCERCREFTPEEQSELIKALSSEKVKG